MTNVLEDVLQKSSVLLRVLLWAQGLNAEDIHIEIFPVYGGKYFSRKAVHNWVEKFSQGPSKVTDDARPSMEVAEIRVKNFYAADYNALVKRWDMCINVGGGCVEKYMFFQVRISHVLRFVSICDLFTDSPSMKTVNINN
jgi:hypothetical protein